MKRRLEARTWGVLGVYGTVVEMGWHASPTHQINVDTSIKDA